MADAISRPLTQDEKKEMKGFNEKTKFDEFKTEAATLSEQHQKKYKPYCATCASNDFERQLKNIQDELVNQGTAISDEDAMKHIKIDPEIYGNVSGFDLIGETEAYDFIMIGNTKTKKLIGYHFNYQCKKRNHGRSVFVPIEVYEKMKASKKESAPPANPGSQQTGGQSPN